MKSNSMYGRLIAASLLVGLFSCDSREKQNPASSEATVSLAPRITMANAVSGKVIEVDSVVVQILAGGKTFTKGSPFDRHFVQIDGIPVNTRWTMTVSGLRRAADGIHWPVWWRGVDSGTTNTVPGTVDWPSVKVVLADTTTTPLTGQGVPTRDTTVLPHGTASDTIRFQVPATDSVYQNGLAAIPSQVAVGYASYSIGVQVPSSQTIKLVTQSGNVTLKTFHFVASTDVKTDTSSPSIRITSPDSAISHISQMSVSIIASIQSTSGVDSVVTWSGTVRKVNKSGPPWVETLPLSPGRNVIVDSVYAKNGKTASASILVYAPKSTLDSVPPVLLRKSPVIQSDSVPWTTMSVKLEWKVFDVGGKVISAGLRSQPGTVAVPGVDSSWAVTQPLLRGRNVFVLIAKDSAGNSDSDSVVVFRRASPQGISLVRGSNTGDRLLPVGTKTVNLTWTVSDTDEIVSLAVNGASQGAPLNGTTVVVEGTARRMTVSATMNLTSDSNLVRFVAVDSSGNVAKDSFLVRVAQIPQAIRSLPVEDSLDLPWDSSAIHMHWNVMPTRGLANVSLFANGAPAPFTIVGASYSAVPNLQVGTNRLVLVVSDSVGDTLRDTVMVVRRSDPFHPEVTWIGNSSRIDTVAYRTTSYSAKWNVVGRNTPPTVTVEGQSPSSTGALQQSGSLYTFKTSLRVWAPGYDTVFRLVAVGAPGDTTFDSVRVVVAADTNKPVVAPVDGIRDTVLSKKASSYTASWSVVDPTLLSVAIDGTDLTPKGSGTYSKVIPLSRDTTWVFLAAKDSSGFVKRDSIRVRRLASVTVSGSGDTLTTSVRAQFVANLGDAQLFSSSDKSNWTPYPSGGIVISTSQLLYTKAKVGSMSIVDSARFLFVPTISGTVPTVVVSASGTATIEDSLSTGAEWFQTASQNRSIDLTSSAKIYARARLKGAVSKVVHATYVLAPKLSPIGGTYSRRVSVAVIDSGADSIMASSNGTSWSRVYGGTYEVVSSGTYSFRSMLGGQISSNASGTYSISRDTSLKSATVLVGTYGQPATIGGSALVTDSLPIGALAAVVSVVPTDSLATVLVNGASGGHVILVNDTATASIMVTNGSSVGRYTLKLNAKKGVTFTDVRDGQTYSKVVIGSQTWMSRNLNYRNTTGMPDTTGVCYGFSADSCLKYGRLYTWAMIHGLPSFCDSATCQDSLSVPMRGICPAGWHLPTYSEWRTFEASVAGNSKGLKAIGWGDGDNSLGFNLAGGGAYNEGTSNESLSASYFWTTDEFNSNEGVFGYLRIAEDLKHISYKKAAALSLRCIEN